VERTQELLYYLCRLLHQDRIPHLRVFVDSPMAVKVTDVFRRHPDLFDRETLRLGRSLIYPGLTMVRSIADSKSINHIRGTAIIIAGSGMCTGGRIKHHLAANVSRKESTVLFIGYQATGTLGRTLLERPESVRILGEEIAVNAKITKINGFSAHADQKELQRWLGQLENSPKRIFITHGEANASKTFAEILERRLQSDIHVPHYLESVQLD
jgi:metallo-beta-lactamase family protein